MFDVYYPLYFDRQGWPIPDAPDCPAAIRWAQLCYDRDYKIVQQDLLHDGGMLSTIWIGLDQGWGFGRPLIFETMRFVGIEGESKQFPDPTDNMERTECLRYSTEEEAHAMHNAILRAIQREEYQ